MADPPNAAGPNFGNPTFLHASCGNGSNGDMFVSYYMDSVDDGTMFMLTTQPVVVRMQAALDGARSAIG